MSLASPSWMPLLVQLSQQASASSLAQLAALLDRHEPTVWNRLSGEFPQIQIRQRVKNLLECFLLSGDLPVALLAAVQATASLKAQEQTQVEVVWTGPLNPEQMRMTHAAVLEVLDQSQRELWLVSYVFKGVMTLAHPLRKALGRGVRLRVVTEERKLDLAIEAFQQMGLDLLAATEFYIWRSDTRRQYSSLHAKCLLADQQKVFITSANFTAAAQYENMEMGVLISGGAEPKRISRLLHHLLQQGLLKHEQPKERLHDSTGFS